MNVRQLKKQIERLEKEKNKRQEDCVRLATIIFSSPNCSPLLYVINDFYFIIPANKPPGFLGQAIVYNGLGFSLISLSYIIQLNDEYIGLYSLEMNNDAPNELLIELIKYMERLARENNKRIIKGMIAIDKGKFERVEQVFKENKFIVSNINETTIGVIKRLWKSNAKVIR